MLIGLAACIAVSFIIIKGTQNNYYKSNPVSTTDNIIYYTYVGIRHIADATNIDALLGTNADPLVLNSNLARCLRKNDFYPYIHGMDTNAPFILDGWGRPMLIGTIRGLPTGASEFLLGLARSNSIAVWSAGKNGNNDWGNSDDVIFKPQ